MRLTSVLAFGLVFVSSVTKVVAQAPLPECAATCFQTAVMAQTRCQPNDIPCICGDQKLNAAIQGCVGQTCTLIETLSAVNTTYAMCDIPIKDRSLSLIVVGVTFGALALIALAVRIMVSLHAHIFGMDDFCAVAAYAFAAPVTFGQVACGFYGFGKDTWAVAPANIYLIMKIVYFNQLSYFVSSGFSKLCFCFMFLRIFPSQHTRKYIYAGMAMSIAFPIAFGLPMTFACKPISAVWTSWDGQTPYDKCINQKVFWFVAAAYNIAVDVYIVFLPIPELLKLNLSRRKKYMLVAIFSTGAITIIVSIARLWALAQYGGTTNPLYDNTLSGIFSPLELNVGIICMCMPAFRRFIARFLPSCFGSSMGSSKDTPKYKHYQYSGYSGKKRADRDTLGGSLFQTEIVKTVDTIVVEEERSEDNVRLVELKGGHAGGVSRVSRSLKEGEASRTGSAEEIGRLGAHTPGMDSLYKAQGRGTSPRGW